MKKLLFDFAAILAIFAIAVITVSECKHPDDSYHVNGRRRGRLGGASPGSSEADCAKFLDIKLFADSPGYYRFEPDAKACKPGPSYVGSTKDGNCHVTLVPSVGKGSGKSGKGEEGKRGKATGNVADAFAASVTCDDNGAVYSIGEDGNGAMTTVERLTEDYGLELDPLDNMPPEERALLEARFAAPGDALSANELRGKVSDQLRDHGDRFPVENHGDNSQRDLQVKVEIGVLVLYTAHAECRNAGQERGCTRTTTTQSSILSRINLAVAETNTAYSLSGVNVDLRLVHAAFDTYVENSTNAFDAALRDVTNDGDGKLDQAHTLRTTYSADIVVLMIDDPHLCGIAWLGPSIGRMFSVTSWNCATGYYSFGHEIGHNFGCNHDRGTANACSSTTYNYGFRDPDGAFRSILAYACQTNQCDGNRGGSCPRVQRFSNNFVGYNMYNGKAIGNANNNNARRINDVALNVSKYYPIPPTQRPTLRPTATPTRPPSNIPSQRPTTARPTTRTPTNKPSIRAPTANPTKTPKPTTARPTTRTPTYKPSSIRPTTRKPTNNPTIRPTSAKPTTAMPTARPTTDIPTQRPTTARPTSAPVINVPAPNVRTSSAPTGHPSSAPTSSPTSYPTTGEPVTSAPATNVPATNKATSSAPTGAPSFALTYSPE